MSQTASGAQVILDFNSDGSRGARGVAAGTITQNTAVRDADLQSSGVTDPANANGPPNTVGGAGVGGVGVTKTDRSGVIALGGQAQSLMPANPLRRGWSFQNKSIANMWFNDVGSSADPAANASTYLPPGAYYESEQGGASVAAISLIGDATGAQFVAKEW